MLGRSQAFVVFGMSVVSMSAFAAIDENVESGAPQVPESTSAAPAAIKPHQEKDGVANSADAVENNTQSPPAKAKPEGEREDWHIEVHGYFRAPLALGLSSRPNPDKPDGPSNLQWSYAPNRVLDWSYYSFAYTRLQEQDWAEMTFHAKKKHVDAAVGWMGYWLAATGYRNPDSAAVPGIAYLTLDTDFMLGGMTPNLAFTMGAWWPGYGYFEKYDTFTLGRFRHMGEQLRLKLPVDSDVVVTLTQGFGTGRDGSFSYAIASNSPLYASKTGADLIAYGNLEVAYQKYVDANLHYNYTWTRDPRLTAEASPTDGKAYSDASAAHMSVLGAEVNVTLPYAGRLWLSPSYISVKNGWALGGLGGTEVMHSQNGLGIAGNYLAFTNSPVDSTGTGSMFNLGFLYENSLSNIMGTSPESLPDLKFSVFALLANASLDLPAGSKITQNSIKQLKYGADATVQAVDWLAFMLRWDTVNYDMDHPAYIFSAITSRMIVSSHFLSGESIYLQYSRYIYGDNMRLAGQWPWGTPLVAGTDVIQNVGPYFNKKPDENVIKLQASIVF
jgi:hypothetical protein